MGTASHEERSPGLTSKTAALATFSYETDLLLAMAVAALSHLPYRCRTITSALLRKKQIDCVYVYWYEVREVLLDSIYALTRFLSRSPLECTCMLLSIGDVRCSIID